MLCPWVALSIQTVGYFLYYLMMEIGRIQEMILKCRTLSGKVGLRRTSRWVLAQSIKGVQTDGGERGRMEED